MVNGGVDSSADIGKGLLTIQKQNQNIIDLLNKLNKKILAEPFSPVFHQLIPLEEFDKLISNGDNKQNSSNEESESEDISDDEKMIEFDLRKTDFSQTLEFSKSLQNVDTGKKGVVSVLKNIYSELTELDKMMGLEDIKDEILDFIFHYCNEDVKKNDLLNFLICGSPGVGKTSLVKILAKILTKMNIVDDNVVYVSASDLIGSHVGDTAKNTRNLIDTSKGVIVIDEIYALGSPGDQKDFCKEFVDVIIGDIQKQTDSQKSKKKRIYVFLGYEEETEQFVMAKNKGLRSRFPFVFRIKNYPMNILKEMFLKKIQDDKYVLDDNGQKELNSIFSKSQKIFPANGRSIDTFFTFCKMIHSRKNINRSKSEKILDSDDINIAFEKYMSKTQTIPENETQLFSLYS